MGQMPLAGGLRVCATLAGGWPVFMMMVEADGLDDSWGGQLRTDAMGRSLDETVMTVPECWSDFYFNCCVLLC